MPLILNYHPVPIVPTKFGGGRLDNDEERLAHTNRGYVNFRRIVQKVSNCHLKLCGYWTESHQMSTRRRLVTSPPLLMRMHICMTIFLFHVERQRMKLVDIDFS